MKATPSSETPTQNTETPPKVALFVTCLVNQFRPSVGFASISLLESVGYDVVVPQHQTCCGQPGYNNGLNKAAQEAAKATIKLLERYDYVVIPSGSCAGMIKSQYPKLLNNDKAWSIRAKALSTKTWELCQFLSQFQLTPLPPHTQFQHKSITYQDSCSCKRELKSTEAPRALLLQACPESPMVELKDPESCCGFGGTFSVKYPDISQHLAANKVNDILDSGTNTLVSADLGCLMNIAGYASRLDGKVLEARHIAEVLANQLDAPSMTTPPSCLEK